MGVSEASREWGEPDGKGKASKWVLGLRGVTGAEDHCAPNDSIESSEDVLPASSLSDGAQAECMPPSFILGLGASNPLLVTVSMGRSSLDMCGSLVTR